ncbi:MAG: hypothetical protein H0W96_15410 [Solirubrobacterales bacterium]|nr:hypothetical protein [Solirubrobacterales bacterium]
MAISRARMLLSATLVATVTLLAGCGDDDKKAAKDDAPTRAEFIKQVDTVCRKTTQQSKPTNRKLQALVDGSGTFSSRLKKAAPLLQTTYELQKAKVDRIEAMQPPTKDRVQIAEIIKTSNAALAELRGGIPVAERGDLKNFIDIAFDANGTRAKAERLGTTYGFRVECFAVPIDLSSF